MGTADVVSDPPAKDELKVWPDDAFKARLPKWQAAVNGGANVDEIVKFARTKGELTPEQERTIRALRPASTADAPSADAIAAKLRAAQGEHAQRRCRPDWQHHRPGPTGRAERHL